MTETTLTLTNTDSGATQTITGASTTAADIVTGVAEGYTYAKVTTTNKLGDVVVNVFKITVLPNVFYIYHSSTKTVEVVPLSECAADGTFNIYAKTASGTLYGGYYVAYQKKGAGYNGGLEGLGEGNVDTNGIAYSKTKCGQGYWLKGKAYTVDGTAMTPTPGATYYLKEVPVEFLSPYMSVIYDVNNSNNIVRIYLITAVDDLNYTNVGLTVKDGSNQAMDIGNRIALTNTFKITSESRDTIQIKASTAFGVAAGFVAVWQLPTLPANETGFTLNAYYVTPDGITVTGAQTRTVNMGDGHVTVIDGQPTFTPGPDVTGITFTQQ